MQIHFRKLVPLAAGLSLIAGAIACSSGSSNSNSSLISPNNSTLSDSGVEGVFHAVKFECVHDGVYKTIADSSDIKRTAIFERNGMTISDSNSSDFLRGKSKGDGSKPDTPIFTAHYDLTNLQMIENSSLDERKANLVPTSQGSTGSDWTYSNVKISDDILQPVTRFQKDLNNPTITYYLEQNPDPNSASNDYLLKIAQKNVPPYVCSEPGSKLLTTYEKVDS